MNRPLIACCKRCCYSSYRVRCFLQGILSPSWSWYPFSAPCAADFENHEPRDKLVLIYHAYLSQLQ